MHRPPWFERVVRELLRLPQRTVLLCGPESGIEYAVHRIHGLRIPKIVIWVDEHTVSVGEEILLSEAIAAGIGPTFIAKRASIGQALQALAEYQRVIGPVFVVIGWAHGLEDLIGDVASVVSPESSLVVVANDEYPVPEIKNGDIVLAKFLKLQLEEAISEARGGISDERVHRLFGETSGNYSLFRVQLMQMLGNAYGSASSIDSWNWGDAVTVDGVLDALIQQSRWSDAFDLACARAPERLTEFIDYAGNNYFNAGSYSYLWSRLREAPPDVKSVENVAYWLVASALATNRQSELIDHAERIVQASGAPELRASTAVIVPTEDMLLQTTRALEMRRSPATLRAHGFALAWEGERTEPIALFREAMRLAEREGAEHLVVACGIDIAEVEIRHGNYTSGAEWAAWAIAEYERRGIHERLREKSAISTYSFAKLLLGNEAEAWHRLQRLDDARSYIDIPGYEGIVSTLGDLSMVRRQFEEAREYYANIHAKAPMEVYCFTSLSLVAVHIASGDWRTATQLADSAFALSRTSTESEQALGDLIVGMAFSESEPARAEEALVSSIDRLTAELHVAQASAWLAIVRLRMGRRKDAAQALRLGAKGIKELGMSGWQLICAHHPLTEKVMQLWTQTEYEFEFRFLGRRTIWAESSNVEIGLRSAEILAALSIHASGLSGERLHAYVYGDATYPSSTLKATVSRLRDVVPIGSNPYSIDATFRADFVTVLELLSVGELQHALNLYQGPLLPGSESPLVQEWREHINESVRAAVLESRDPDHLIQLGTQLDDDLEIWEAARACLTPSDYRRPVVSSRIRRIKAAWKRDEFVAH